MCKTTINCRGLCFSIWWNPALHPQAHLLHTYVWNSAFRKCEWVSVKHLHQGINSFCSWFDVSQLICRQQWAINNMFAAILDLCSFKYNHLPYRSQEEWAQHFRKLKTACSIKDNPPPRMSVLWRFQTGSATCLSIIPAPTCCRCPMHPIMTIPGIPKPPRDIPGTTDLDCCFTLKLSPKTSFGVKTTMSGWTHTRPRGHSLLVLASFSVVIIVVRN